MGKKGQVSTTMTWVVATIIIFLIMLIFLYSTGLFAGSKYIKNIGNFEGKTRISALKFPEQQETLFAMAKDTEINALISSGSPDEIELEKKVKPILEGLKKRIVTFGAFGNEFEIDNGWNLVVYKNGEKTVAVKTYSKGVDLFDALNFYTILENDPNIKLDLYLECDRIGGECSDYRK